MSFPMKKYSILLKHTKKEMVAIIIVNIYQFLKMS